MLIMQKKSELIFSKLMSSSDTTVRNRSMIL